jgi:hypothetical protein
MSSKKISIKPKNKYLEFVKNPKNHNPLKNDVFIKKVKTKTNAVNRTIKSKPNVKYTTSIMIKAPKRKTGDRERYLKANPVYKDPKGGYQGRNFNPKFREREDERFRVKDNDIRLYKPKIAGEIRGKVPTVKSAPSWSNKISLGDGAALAGLAALLLSGTAYAVQERKLKKSNDKNLGTKESTLKKKLLQIHTKLFNSSVKANEESKTEIVKPTLKINTTAGSSGDTVSVHSPSTSLRSPLGKILLSQPGGPVAPSFNRKKTI